MRYILLLVGVFLYIHTSQAQNRKFEAVITKSDGSKLVGTVKEFIPHDDIIKFRTSKEEKWIKVPAKTIASLLLKFEKGQELFFERIKVLPDKDYYVLSPLLYSGKLKVYQSRYFNSGTYWEHWYLMRPGDAFATRIFGDYKHMTEMIRPYFQDCPQLMKRIEERAYKSYEDLVLMATEYDRLMHNESKVSH